MKIKPKVLSITYVLMAIVALVFTWWHIPEYLGEGLVEANILFWKDALLNSHAAGRFLVADLMILAFACNLSILLEGRRLKIRFLYAYVVGGVVVAISVAFPLFMAARTLKLEENGPQGDGYFLKAVDVVALLLLFGISLAASIVLI
ncbi:MAG: hypothetical protein ACI9OO_000010 [Bacteroidia bacterium]|jgi:hypothetical protein